MILVLTRSYNLTEAAMNYSLNVAGRLRHRILVAYVNTLPFLRSGSGRRERFAQGVNENATLFINKAERKDVQVSYVKESGKMGKVVSRLCRIVQKIDFIIVDDDVRVDEVVSRSPVPVFSVDKPLKAKQYQVNEHAQAGKRLS